MLKIAFMGKTTIKSERTLLWENPNTSLAKGEFSVTLPKAYGVYLVQYALDTGGGNHANSFVFADSVNSWASVISSGNSYARSVSISGTTASFSNGWFGQSVNSNAMIPVVIYGIK